VKGFALSFPFSDRNLEITILGEVERYGGGGQEIRIVAHIYVLKMIRREKFLEKK